MAELSLSVPAYDASVGVVAPAEGGTITVEVVNGSVEISGDAAGLRDLARMCLALSDAEAPSGAAFTSTQVSTRWTSDPLL